MDHQESLIRDRAYQIWESEGRPEGRDAEHWERARRELETETPTESESGNPGSGGTKPGIERSPGAAAETPARREQVNGQSARKPVRRRTSESEVRAGR